MCRVDHQSIHPGIHQSGYTLEGIERNAYTGSYTQTTFRILASLVTPVIS